jgi:hypothetical protein
MQPPPSIEREHYSAFCGGKPEPGLGRELRGDTVKSKVERLKLFGSFEGAKEPEIDLMIHFFVPVDTPYPSERALILRACAEQHLPLKLRKTGIELPEAPWDCYSPGATTQVTCATRTFGLHQTDDRLVFGFPKQKAGEALEKMRSCIMDHVDVRAVAMIRNFRRAMSAPISDLARLYEK